MTPQERLDLHEKRKRNTVRYILAWMAQFDYTEAPGIVEILVEEGFIDVLHAEIMADHLNVADIED